MERKIEIGNPRKRTYRGSGHGRMWRAEAAAARQVVRDSSDPWLGTGLELEAHFLIH